MSRNCTFITATLLTSNLAEWGPAVIAGNLPYYITSPIVERFLKLAPNFPIAVFLMQLEVAERLLAKPNSRDYGYLTVATQIVCAVELVCKVPASAFSPPPKVESAAVRLVAPARIDARFAGTAEIRGPLLHPQTQNAAQ